MKLIKRFKWLAIPFLVIFCACFLMNGRMASAQATLVTVEGTLADEDGAPLPGATVTFRNTETGYVGSGVTGADGGYLVSGLQPGQYECEVNLSGFATIVRKGMTFNVGARLTLDFTLAPATLEEEVTVTAESPMVEVTKSEISSIVGRQKIDDLPLLDRNFNYLTVMKVGVNPGLRANAQPGGYEEVVIDGVSNENVSFGVNSSGIPADAIQEFRVITNMFEAEYGNASGLYRMAITRSGTNQIRGRLSFFYRDDTLDDVNYFVNHDGYEGPELADDEWEKPPYDQYRAGGFLGGPIIKDKAHFFLSYDGYNLTTYRPITNPLVPRETVELSRIENQFLGKINFQLDEKNHFSARLSLSRQNREAMPGGVFWTKDALYNGRTPHTAFQGNWTFYPSDNTMNELRFQYANYGNYLEVQEGMENDFTLVRPSIYEGPHYALPQWNKWKRIQFIDNLSLFLGDHRVKIGIDASRFNWDLFNSQYIPGYVRFTTDAPFDAANPATYPYFIYYNEGSPFTELPYWNIGAFVQDSWRVTPKLTLNIGLRYTYIDATGASLSKWNIRNLNPRFGFSYDPVGDGKTSIRGGIGTYTTNPLTNFFGYFLWSSGLTSRMKFFPNFPDHTQPNPFRPEVPGSATTTVWELKEGQTLPYTVQATLGIQREVLTNLSLGVDLVYARGHGLMWRNNLNPIIPGTRFVRVDPTKGDLWQNTDTGKSDYKGLYFTLNKRYANGWSLDIAYTLSKSLTDVEGESTGIASYDDLERKFMWGPSNLDARHVLSVSGIVDLPLGFQFSGLFLYRSALPWNADYPTDVNLDGLLTDYVDDYRNSRRGFDSMQINARLSKYINISRFRLQVFAEAYNLTNRVNFGSVYNNFGLPRFGEPTAAGAPRLLQFGARLDF